MTTEKFRIEARLRPDGKVYFTSQDLPGFRLLLDRRDDPDDYNSEIIAALEVFYPLFKAAEARQKTPIIETADRSAAHESFRLVASFGMAS